MHCLTLRCKGKLGHNCSTDGNLLSHTDSEDWYLATEIPDGVDTYPYISVNCWMAGAGTDYELCWPHCNQLIKLNLIVAENTDSRALKYKVLVDIPGEGVIVIDENEIDTCRNQR